MLDVIGLLSRNRNEPHNIDKLCSSSICVREELRIPSKKIHHAGAFSQLNRYFVFVKENDNSKYVEGWRNYIACLHIQGHISYTSRQSWLVDSVKVSYIGLCRWPFGQQGWSLHALWIEQKLCLWWTYFFLLKAYYSWNPLEQIKEQRKWR